MCVGVGVCEGGGCVGVGVCVRECVCVCVREGCTKMRTRSFIAGSVIFQSKLIANLGIFTRML